MMNDRRGINLRPTGHPVDKDLPAHWTGITLGQTMQQRTLAILTNIGTDKELRRLGVDPATRRASSNSGVSGRVALARIAALRK